MKVQVDMRLFSDTVLVVVVWLLWMAGCLAVGSALGLVIG